MDHPARATRLVRPGPEHLPDYVAALQRGWSPDNILRAATAKEHLDFIARDSAGFLASLDDPEARGGPVTLPDGSVRPRLPGFRRWIWDGGFCGSIGMRWQPGTPDLPPHVLGHVGYAVVPWRRREGHATRALGLLLAEIAPLGLPWVDLTTDPDNPASIRVIEANGGTLLRHFAKGPELGGGEGLRFRIALPPPAPRP
ncbi:GNAT family N-acetyltransferase [Paracraurococcus ruber]|uniref:GNAT family N-acetyltransferase n=1 Tax=Paracraurococcus ruber TaxID=77675 RepID=A0ABS1D322_9PROT|nr:GNAT family N-acetyltransferase [Paracraurococcus ruber]MBK1660888.1 GNAT family N-acetyltransferase [Paracraurococcus ruber]TDG26951.1 GNAT family N-acetyltransferase [Paracraurococcus ruber]